MSVGVKVVWLRTHCSSIRVQRSHWSINAAVMGTVPALHYEKKKEKNPHCICCKDGMVLQDYAEHTELTNTEVNLQHFRPHEGTVPMGNNTPRKV